MSVVIWVKPEFSAIRPRYGALFVAELVGGVAIPFVLAFLMAWLFL